jgi:hypothetical protein
VETGLILAGGDAGETAALVEGNVLRGVTVADDDVTARGTAVVVQGGGAFGLPLGGPFFLSGMEFPGYRQAGTVTRNTVAELTFSGNRFEALDGTVVLGALSTATEDRLRENVVRSLTFKGNRFVTSRSSITAIAGLVMTSGTVVQSAVAGSTGPATSARRAFRSPPSRSPRRRSPGPRRPASPATPSPTSRSSRGAGRTLPQGGGVMPPGCARPAPRATGAGRRA